MNNQIYSTQDLSSSEKRKAHYKSNKKLILDSNKKSYERNKEKIRAQQRLYYQNNKKQIMQRHSAYEKERRSKDKLFKIKAMLRSNISMTFKRIGQNKPTNTQTLLGCTWEEAKAHFESLFTEGMNWNNHGEWHIDHIRPVASFKADELHLMNHISNLQPLWAKDNFSKGDKLY